MDPSEHWRTLFENWPESPRASSTSADSLSYLGDHGLTPGTTAASRPGPPTAP